MSRIIVPNTKSDIERAMDTMTKIEERVVPGRFLSLRDYVEAKMKGLVPTEKVVRTKPRLGKKDSSE